MMQPHAVDTPSVAAHDAEKVCGVAIRASRRAGRATVRRIASSKARESSPGSAEAATAGRRVRAVAPKGVLTYSTLCSKTSMRATARATNDDAAASLTPEIAQCAPGRLTRANTPAAVRVVFTVAARPGW